MTTFDLLGPLPTGTTVLEASAGTGKTYALASLAVRFLAEGEVTAPSLMLITFSRMATQELRSRVRERLLSAIAALRGALTTPQLAPPADAVLALLVSGDAATLTTRLGRLEAAAADFDNATIATTHEFSQRMLIGLGVLADTDPAPQFVTDISHLAREVAADVYARRIGPVPVPGFGFGDDTWAKTVGAATIAHELANEPAAQIEVPPGPLVAMARAKFALETRAAITDRKRRQRLFTYADQLTGLLTALTDEVTGQAARDRLAARFRVVLVDEFQDTDPVQWRILHTAFHGRATLVLIGDPKQAIYGFRGADIHSYAAAVQVADSTAGLTENHRTDKAVVAAVGDLFAGAAVGTGITVPPVTAHLERRISAPDHRLTQPFRVRGINPVRPGSEPKQLSDNAARDAIAADLRSEVVRLLTSDVVVATGPAPAPLRPRDIAVLVRSNRFGHKVTSSLRAAGIACVFSGEGSVLAGPAATHWVTLLEALLDTRSEAAAKVALTPFVNATFETLATADDAWRTALMARLHSWAVIWQRHDIAALWQTITAQPEFAASLLATPAGTRNLADLRQIAHLLQTAEAQQRRGRSLIEWLTEQIQAKVEAPRALETDDDAVQVLTIHKSKGLQFPVVLVPEATIRSRRQNQDKPFIYHRDGTRYLDVSGLSGPDAAARAAAAAAEDDAESLRELYVAVTRAQVAVVTWWANTKGVDGAALHRLLCRPPDQVSPAPTYPPAALRSRPHITLEIVPPSDGPPPAIAPAAAPLADQAVLQFTRVIDHTWRRTSYSGLTALVHESAPFGHIEFDEPAPPADEAETADSGPAPSAEQLAEPSSLTSPMADFAGGTEFGTLVHAVLEDLDWSADPIEPELTRICAEQLARTSIPIAAADLAAALVPVLATPLGPLAADRPLRQFRPTDRLSELSFDLPLGADRAPAATLGSIADLCAEHLGSGDLLAGYPALLRQLDPGSSPLRGVLTGSIDSVLRLTPENRFLVVDYKTNRLGDDAQQVSAYRTPDLVAAMQASHYPLQAMLYSVALHRYLRWRLPAYDPEQHLGGILYLFVRGMAGEPLAGAAPTGVFSWRPPTALVTQLSHLLAAHTEGPSHG